jgi:hypothetical protein
LIEASTSFTNILAWGCIFLHYSDLTNPNSVSFRKNSQILMGYCKNCWGNCEILHWLLIVLCLIQFHWWNCSFSDILSIVIISVFMCGHIVCHH